MFKIFFFILYFLIKNLSLSLLAESSDNNSINYVNNSYEKFTPTTKINGNLFFTLGALDSPVSNEALQFSYENKIRLNTSFKDTDKLLIIFESGNAFDNPLNLDLQSKKGDNLKISTLLYKFEMASSMEAVIGPKMFGYHGLAGKSTDYNERIAILDGSNYTTSSGIGPGIGISTRKNNGLNASLKLASNSSKIDNEATHLISQVGLTKKKFGGTITSNLNKEFNAIGLAAFYKPNYFPSISASIEQKNGDSINSIENWVIALQKNYQNKKFGLALGTYNEEERICYEGWSEIGMSNGVKLIPVIFLRENDNDKSDLGFAINTKISY